MAAKMKAWDFIVALHSRLKEHEDEQGYIVVEMIAEEKCDNVIAMRNIINSIVDSLVDELAEE